MDYYRFTVDLMTKLVALPSESQNEETVARFLSDILEEIGMDTQLKHIEGNSYNVIAKSPVRNIGRSLLLGGHIDTVLPGSGWDTNPYQVVFKDGNYYGRGTSDMKCGLAAQIAVLKKLADEGRLNQGNIDFVCVCDEERFSLGAHDYADTLQKEGTTIPEFGILAEPHFNDIVIGAAGKALICLDVEGAPGHAANPETGINAIDSMSLLLNLIQAKYSALYKAKEAGSYCVLKVASRYEGYSLSIPDHCSATLNKQFMPHESLDDFIQDIYTLFQENHIPGTLSVQKSMPTYSAYQVDPQNPNLAHILDIVKEKHGMSLPLVVNQSVSDANIFSHDLHIPTILFGPQGHDYHKANEYVIASSIPKYMDTLEDFIDWYFSS